MPTQENNFKDTVIGAIPDEWEVASVAKMYLFTKKARDLKFNEYDSIPFVPMDLVPIGKLSFGDFILKKPSEFSSGTYFEAGDLLLAKITPSFENGKQGIIPELPHGFGVATTEVIPIKEIPQVSNIHFLAYFLLRDDIRSSLAGKMEGSTGRQRLSQTVVENLEIPLPPLPEQRTIVAILSKIQQAIEVQEKIIERTKELKKSMMAKLFTEGLHGEELKESEIGLMPKSWEVADLGNVCEVYSGFAFKSEDYLSAGIPIIKIGNLQDGKVELSSDQSYFPKEMLDDSLAKYTLATGDVLVAMTGATTGKIALVSKELGGSLLNQRVGKFVVKDLSRFELSFGKHYFLTSTFQKQIRDNILQSAQGNVSPKNIERMLIPLPELSEQKDIANVFERLDSKLGTTTRKRQALQHLFKSMLHQLMTGTIRVNNIELQAPKERNDPGNG